MSSVPIPAWNANGVLPPINAAQPTSAERSPYLVSLTDFVLRFGTTADRRRILDGFLRYREALHSVGLDTGFQWIDGSYLEDVETTQSRSPGDIDVVTFYRLPPGRSQADILGSHPGLFPTSAASLKALKLQFFVDGYVQGLDSSPESVAHKSAYWYSMWSHQRNLAWKGFLEVDLAQHDDAAARQALVSMSNQP